MNNVKNDYDFADLQFPVNESVSVTHICSVLPFYTPTIAPSENTRKPLVFREYKMGASARNG